MRIGVLAVQGAFAEHIAVLRKLKAEALPVRLPSELVSLDGLIIPGGESTTISQLMRDYDLSDKIKKLAESGLPILGTCAGLIILAKTLSDASVPTLGLMDVTVRRNAFGRQRESFEAALNIPALGEKPFPGVFIRAPIIEQANGNASVLTRLDDGTIVAAQQEKLVATAFHPELTSDPRFHRYFLNIVANRPPSQETKIAESNH
jgi:5'-phosphate synthase pdxT subunit